MAFLLLISDPLDYLGLRPGYWFEYTGFYADSTAGDPKKVYDLRNRTEVGDEFTYQGHRAVSISSVDSLHNDTLQPSDTVMSKVDTAYADTPWVRFLTDIGLDTTLDLQMYRVPFAVGDRWSTGAEGFYLLDVDGDSQVDSVWVLGDTSAVETLETVEVPAGSFEAYKVIDSTTGFIRLATGDSGRLTIFRAQWWTPGTGMVRDSSELVLWGYYGSYLIPVAFQWRVHELSAVGVQERPEPGPGFELLGGEGYLLLSSPRGAWFEVYGASGRLVARLWVEGQRNLRLSPGVYLVKGPGGATKGLVR